MFRDALSGRLGGSWWKQNLRMTRDTFNILCNELYDIPSECRREGGCYSMETGC